MAAPGNFDVATDRRAGTLIVSPRVQLDLRGVEFMDTSGLRYVLELVERGVRDGFAVRIVRGPAAVQRVFEVSGLESRLPFVDQPVDE